MRPKRKMQPWQSFELRQQLSRSLEKYSRSVTITPSESYIAKKAAISGNMRISGVILELSRSQGK